MKPHRQPITRERGTKEIQTDPQRSQEQQCARPQKDRSEFQPRQQFQPSKKSTHASNGDEGKRQQKHMPESTTQKERRLKSKPQLRGFNKPALNCKS